MNASIEIKKILAQVDQMGDKEKLMILEKIKSILEKEDKNHSSKLSLYSLKGLGSDIWKDTTVDDYIKREREW